MLLVKVGASEKAAAIEIEVGDGTGAGGVWLVPVRKAAEVQIARGENAGQRMTYTNVVRGLHYVGSWSGPPARFEVPVSEARSTDSDSYVVLLQDEQNGRPGAILGAAKGPGF